jgi:hypothetical protein
MCERVCGQCVRDSGVDGRVMLQLVLKLRILKLTQIVFRNLVRCFAGNTPCLLEHSPVQYLPRNA